MKIGYWEYVKSFFFETVYERRKSIHNGEMEIILSKGQWQLATQNAIYSFGDRYTSFKIAFDEIGIMDFPVKSMLMLGTGLGSIAQLLNRHPTLRKITCVDIDPEITALAQKYWKGNPNIEVEFITKDALEFVAEANQQFDLVTVDIFIDDLTPDAFIHRDFMGKLRNILNAKSILLFSKLHYTPEQKKANELFANRFSIVFPKSFSISAGYNLMFTVIKDS